MNKRKYFILDFDSTFIKVEALDELAKISLKKDKEKVSKLAKISNLTKQAMEGKMSFPKSLEKRLELMNASKDDLAKLNNVLKNQVSNSILRNKDFFRKFAVDVYIVSGGFKEYILPLVSKLGIKEENVFGNKLITDKGGYNRI